MNIHGDNQPVNEDALAKMAVDMYQRDKENRETESSMKEALQEMNIPQSYYDAARAELARKQADQLFRQAKARSLTKITLAIALILGGLAYPFVLSMLHKPQPFVLGFTNASDWALEVSDGSSGRAGPIQTPDGPGNRIVVDHFKPSVASSYPGQFWIQENSMTGPLDLRKLNEVTFVARGSGLSNVRLRFNSGSQDWVTSAFNLTDQWQTFKVNLNSLWVNRMSGSGYVPGGYSRPDDQIQNVSIQVGEYVNPITASGSVDVGPLHFK